MNASAELFGVLERIGDRFRRVRLWGGLAVCWVALAVVGLVAAGYSAGPNRTIALAVAAAALIAGPAWWLISRRTARDPRWLARRVEERHPDLSALLLMQDQG